MGHLLRALDATEGPLHLVVHSLREMFSLYLLRALPKRITRLTLIDPVVVSVLDEFGEHLGLAEVEAQYQRFINLLPDFGAARAFVEHWSGARAIVPLGRGGRTDEIASAVAFLASDESSHVAGTELFVDGGLAQV